MFIGVYLLVAVFTWHCNWLKCRPDNINTYEIILSHLKTTWHAKHSGSFAMPEVAQQAVEPEAF